MPSTASPFPLAPALEPASKASPAPAALPRRRQAWACTAVASACAWLALTAAAAAPAQAQAQPNAAAPQAQRVHAIALPAQDLAQALNALARQTGQAISADHALMAGKTAPAVAGQLTTAQALRQLLAGSGLQAEAVAGGWVVRRAPAATPTQPATAATRGEAQALPAVTVTAAPDLSGTTEGTRSFTTRAMSSATGLALSPRETPQSVSVITRERIEAQGMSSLSDAVAAAPGVHSAPIDGRGESYHARGFGINTVQLDGVSMEWSSGWQSGESHNNLAIYDRVEVVRGATGLLHGTGDPSASINLVRKRAQAERFTGNLEGEIGSWKHRRLMADLSAPLNANASVRARLVAQAISHDSFMEREHLDSKMLYTTLEADLSSATRLTVGADWQNPKPKAPSWGGLQPWYSDGSRIDWPRSYNTAPHWAYWASTQKTLFAKLEHRFNDDWSLQVNGQHAHNSLSSRLSWAVGLPDRETGEGMEVSGSGYKSKRPQTDLNARLQGQFDAWGRQHELMAGLATKRQKLQTFGTHETDDMPLGNIWAYQGNLPEPQPMAQPWSETTVTSQRSAYAALRLHVAQPLKLIVGARLTDWKRTGEATDETPAYVMRHKNIFTPYIGAVYDLGGGYSAYASATRIFKPQDRRDRHGQYLDPLKGQNLEAGLKAEWLDGQLNGSFALFQTTQDNLAEADGDQRVPGTADEQAYRAIKGTKARGYELELAGRLADGWDVGLGWTQFSSKDAKGNRVQTTRPDRLLKLYTQYRLPGAWHKLTLGAGLNWQGRIYKDVRNPVTRAPEQLAQNAYALLSLNARYQFTPQLAARLAVNNALGKAYFANVGFYNRVTWGAPRSVMLTVDYRF
ncbi:TonB-dependent siderophore receptor [Vandammella animalimorsus]|uniref:TonB-dependent siderophore receptor n=1 Tax=Vandammella animalimorsus TaxID=2029117 RepID=A0A2A2AYE4_9BURK|nr:TonB-dependent receptor [Vandammella animalimorsus]PAT42761.1 TonB-dependent siderophore receptor [Vandammella animalimorsus]